MDAAGAADRRRFIIYGLYRDDVQAASTAQLQKLVNAITRRQHGARGGVEPVAPCNLYEPLFEVTHSGWYWQITAARRPQGPQARLGLARNREPAFPHAKNVAPDATGIALDDARARPASRCASSSVIDTLGHEPDKPRYSIIVAGPADWLEASRRQLPLPR